MEESQDVEVYIWGKAHYGQAGNSETGDQTVPSRVSALSGKKVTQVACGLDHTSALCALGDVYTWGNGEKGKLGHGTDENELFPRVVEGLKDKGIVEVACGKYHTAAISEGGLVYTWGWDKYGELGHHDGEEHLVPKVVEDLKDVNVCQIACSDTLSACVTNTGDVFTWGSGEFGRLGYGDTRQQKSPRLVEALQGKGVRSLSCGKYHAAAVTVDGDIYTWGYGSYGQLGHGDCNSQMAPTLVTFFKDICIKQVFCGANHTVALTDTSQVYAWGGGGDGQLGMGDRKRQNVPQCCTSLSDKGVRTIGCGGRHTAVLVGWGREGRLGHGDMKDRTVPELVRALTDQNVIQVSCGTDHTVAIALSQEDLSVRGSTDGTMTEPTTEKQKAGDVGFITQQKQFGFIADGPKSTQNEYLKILAEKKEIEDRIAALKSTTAEAVSSAEEERLAFAKYKEEVEEILKQHESGQVDAVAQAIAARDALYKEKRDLELQLHPESKVSELSDDETNALISQIHGYLTKLNEMDLEKKMRAEMNKYPSINELDLQLQECNRGADLLLETMKSIPNADSELGRLLLGLMSDNVDLHKRINGLSSSLMSKTIKKLEGFNEQFHNNDGEASSGPRHRHGGRHGGGKQRRSSSKNGCNPQ